MHYRHTSLLLYVLPFIAYAQAPMLAWEAFFDGSMPGVDEARDVIVAQDNTVYVTGAARNLVPQGTITTVRYSTNGAVLMTDNVYGPSQETMNEGESMAMDAEGHIYVAGAFSANNGDMVLIKYGPNGRLWRKNYEPYWFGSDLDHALDVAVGVDGSPCIAGSITSLDGMGLENFIIKADSAGEQLWTDHSSPSSADEWATEVAVASDGTIYLAGHWWNLEGTGGIDVSVAHYTPGGTRLWDRGFSAPGSEERAMDIGTTPLGDVVVCGTAQGVVDNDALVFARDPSGELLWSHLIDGSGSGSDEAVALAVLPDGRVAVAAHVVLEAGAGNQHAVRVLMLDGEQVMWFVDYIGEAELGAWPTDLALAADGRLVIGGYETAAGGITTDGLVLACSVDGQILWHVAYDAGADQNERFNGVAVNGAGDVIACGAAFTAPEASRYVTVQYGSAVGLKEQGADAAWSVHPSLVQFGEPVDIFSEFAGNGTCSITDATGRTILRRAFIGRMTWTPPTPGMYMDTLDRSGVRRTSRAVVQ